MGALSIREAWAIKNMLETFKRASGLEVNKAKSHIFYFNTTLLTKHSINWILEFSEGPLPTKYFGAPLLAGKATQRNWKELLDKMASKISSWTHRALNFPSQVTLVKAVLQTMPSYVFSVLDTPKGILKKIRAIQWNFLLGSTQIKLKWALVDWETNDYPKRDGGLGLRDLKITNQVLNSKIWWWLVTHKGEPWANFWQEKYAKGRPSQNLIWLNQDI